MEEIATSSQEQNPRASIVIPVLNRSALLDRCLSSLLCQDFPFEDLEILICDDGSTEDLRSVVARFQRLFPKMKVLRQDKSKGPAAARNMGVRCSKAPIVVTLDSDVICTQDFLRRLVGALEEHHEWMAAQGAVIPVGASSSPLWDAPINNGEAYLTGASAYRAKALFRLGGFDEALIVGEDAAIAAEILEMGGFGFLEEAVVYHPRRRVTLRTHWQWRRNWKYEMILAKRYGFLSFPGHPAGRFPRLRVALAAVVTLAAGRFIEGMKYMRCNLSDGVLACLYALFDVLCGVLALPDIIFSRVPLRKSYLSNQNEDTGQ